MNSYIALAISIVSEIFGTTMLKMSEGFTNSLPSLGVVVGFGMAFYFLSICLRTIPLSFAYSIWAGLGTALTALLGVFIWKEHFTVYTLIGIILIIVGVVFLNAKNTKNEPKPSN
ncbi:multidrug efflux SMR transporter [Bacillus mycoides]|uniref:DMT family transporter n=1 Tax=Bacillus mycoides TaxID=1405 RepID=UPI003D230BEE